ncbi:MAG: GNAT family N-acetyltransferase [Deltaproteobacteria bacterium]|nr:GNAT family N-acetyltransferase [Deltaproteobacteria bacterium]
MWRRASPKDHDVIAELSERLYAEDPSPKPPPTRADALRILEWLEREPVRGRAAALELEGEVRGYALLISFLSNELKGEICILDELYVVRSERGRGHATSLIDATARGEGPWGSRPVAIELEVTPDNHAARALYARLGFAPIRNALMRRLLAE